jgi:pimeloyl-ACP methyl ester carboxylesterase
MRPVAPLLLWFGMAGLAGCGPAVDDEPAPRMSYLTVDGVRIAVYESPGTEGPGVLLVHGNTSSANAFREVLTSEQAKKRRVVAIDLPGYGNSEDTAYSIATFNKVISQAAVELGVDDGVMVGWSLGGDLVLQASHLLPNAKGYFLFGTAPLGGGPPAPSPFLTPEESYAGLATTYGFTSSLTPEQIDQYVEAFFRPGWTQVPSFFYEDGYRTDPGTRQAVLTAASGLDPDFLPEVPIAQQLTVPIALVHAQEDAFVRREYLEAVAPGIPMLWRKQVVVVPGAGHAIQWEKPGAFVDLLEEFLDDL